MGRRLAGWLGRGEPDPRLGLALVFGLAVLVPALLVGQVIVVSYRQSLLDDAHARAQAGVDTINGLIQQESVRAIDNAQLEADRLGPATQTTAPDDLVQRVVDGRAALRGTTLLALVDGSGRLLASDPASNLPLANDGQVKSALGGKPAVGMVARVPLAIEAAAPMADDRGAAVVAVNVDDTFLNVALHLTGLEAALVENVQGSTRVVAASHDIRRSLSVAQDTAINAGLLEPSADHTARLSVGSDDYELVVHTLPRTTGAPYGTLLVGGSATAIDKAVGRAWLWTFAAAVVGALVTAGIGGLIGGRFASTSQRLARVTRALADEQHRAERLDAVLASLAEGVIVEDADRRVVLVNPAARMLLSLPANGSAEGGYTLQVANGESLDDSLSANERVIRSYSAAVRATETQQTYGSVTVLRDATREQELDRVKSEFLAVVSHELQTPLTAIKGALELVLDDETGQLSRVQRRFLDTIERNCTRLAGLVGDLLDLSRLEAGRLELSPQPLDVASVVRGVLANLANLFDAHHGRVTVAVPDRLPPILGDRRRVEQVFTNLLANAAKYTPPDGEVAIEAWSDGAEVQIAISDTGPGVPDAERELVFNKFYRGRDALRRGQAGSGLGLAIVKSLVELHGGRVELEDARVGRGARFVVSLPCALDDE